MSKTHIKQTRSFFTKLGICLLNIYSKIVCRPQYYGRENIPTQGPFVLIGNHQSFFDVMLVHLEVSPNVRWVAKDDLLKIPVLNTFIKSLDTIFVDRGGVNISAIKEILTTLKKDGVIGIFPEATRLRNREIGEVLPKDAVISLLGRINVPIVPFCINTPLKAFRKNHVFFGKPFKLSKTDSQNKEAAKYLIMRKIYELQGWIPEKLEEKFDEEKS